MSKMPIQPIGCDDFGSLIDATSPMLMTQTKKYTTSPKRPESHGIDSNKIASAETTTMPGTTSTAYCSMNTNGSTGASPRTSCMIIDVAMKPPMNVIRNAR